MKRNTKLARCTPVLLSAVLVAMANAAPEGEVAAEERVEARQQEQTQQQYRERDAQAEMPDEKASERQHEQENAGEAQAPGPAVKQGPYGDKQYHKKKGSPAPAGEQRAAQKQGSR